MQVDCLGHFIRPGSLEVPSSMTEAMTNLKLSTTSSCIRSFPELCNVYQRFIKGYSKLAKLLMDPLKKSKQSKLDTLPPKRARSVPRSQVMTYDGSGLGTAALIGPGHARDQRLRSLNWRHFIAAANPGRFLADRLFQQNIDTSVV